MAHTSIQLNRSLESLEKLHAVTAQFVKASSLNAIEAIELAVVVEELFVNAIRHSTGHRGDIEVQLTEREGDLTVQFMDMDVDRFDITAVTPDDLDKPIDQRRPGGMGLYMIQQFADQIHYRYENGNGIITIEKKLGK